MPAAAKKAENIAQALFAVQSEIQKVAKKSTNSHFGNTYAALPDIIAELHPILQKNELLLSQVMDVSPVTEKPGLRTVLFHIPSEQNIEGFAAFPDGLNAQQTGSAVTYFRRYSILAMLGIVADDDDGNAASAAPKAAPAPVQATTPAPFVDGEGAVLEAAPGTGIGGGLVL